MLLGQFLELPSPRTLNCWGLEMPNANNQHIICNHTHHKSSQEGSAPGISANNGAERNPQELRG
eukprot:13663115-Alexandrium_andersonii.AAC.1